MTLNRLIFPLSEHAMPDWMRHTALADILPLDFSALHDDALYRNLDRLHPNRDAIERHLAEREKTLFNLDDTLYLYDLTSTYFEGEVSSNPQAKRGYSRDKRGDAKQVLVGLVLDRDGFPKAHEIFDGNRQDRTTVGEMLDSLEKRVGRKPGATVVVDRGMAYDEDLEQIRGARVPLPGGHAAAGAERLAGGIRGGGRLGGIDPHPVAAQSLSGEIRGFASSVSRRGTKFIFSASAKGARRRIGRFERLHEQRLKKDLEKLQARVEKGRLKEAKKIYQAIGRLQERYPRVARYYHLDYDPEQKTLTWQEDSEKKTVAEKLDGGYVLKTDRQDLTADEIWRTYILLTRVEAAFRAMKSPLAERPIFHHLEHRTQTHIFLCVLAYHLLVASRSASWTGECTLRGGPCASN